MTDMVLPCQHVAEELDNNRVGQFYEVDIFLVCEACLHEYKLERMVDKDIWAEDDELFEQYFETAEKMQHWPPRCSECVAAVQVEQARREGMEDPFPVYERTLNFHSRDVINELQTLLKENFQFQNSIVEEDRPALFVRPGTYRQPLTVRIYYVISETEQSQIVSLIDGFFEKLRANQVKVEFLEAEVWHTWSDPETGISGGKKGQERLLKEIFLNC